MPGRPALELDVDQVRGVLYETGGNLALMGRRLGLTGKTWQRWLTRHPVIHEEARRERERLQAAAVFEPDEGQLLAVIEQMGGSVGAIVKQYRTSRNTFMAYVERHPNVKQALQDAEEFKVDVAEHALFQAVTNREAWAVTFMLKTKGKRRGYIERSDSLNINVDLTRLSVAQLERLAAGEHPANVLGTHEESSVVGPRAYTPATTSTGGTGAPPESTGRSAKRPRLARLDTPAETADGIADASI